MIFQSCQTTVTTKFEGEEKKISETALNDKIILRSQPAEIYQNDQYAPPLYNETMVVVRF